MKNIGFLLDTTEKVGSGHFWRCFNLAQQLKNQIKNCKIYFLSNSSNIFFLNLLKKIKIKYIKINKLDNLKKIFQIIREQKIDYLVTDIYKLNLKKKILIKKKVKKLIVIDDFDHKKHDSSVYINNNFLSKSSINRIKNNNKNSLLLLGNKFFIFNHKIKTYRKKLKIRNKIKNIFIFFGTYDLSNETFKCLEKISKIKNVNFFVPMSNLNKNFHRNYRIFKAMKNTKVLLNYSNEELLKILIKSDISIGAGGVNLVERISLGLPSIVIKISKNQENTIDSLNKKKIIIYAGEKSKMNYSLIYDELNKLISNKNKFISLSKKTYAYFENKDLYLLSKKLSLIINQS